MIFPGFGDSRIMNPAFHRQINIQDPAMNHDSYNQGPSEFLAQNMDLLFRGDALDIAMGRGRNSIYLAKNGFTVEGVDNSPEAISYSLNSASNQNISIKALVADLENEYQIKKDSYDLIICFNYLQRSLIPDILEGLRFDGIIIYETYIIDQVRFGKPENPDFLLKHNELLYMFKELRCLRYQEGIFNNEKAKAGIIAQKTQG